MILASLLVDLLYVVIGSLLGCLIFGTILGAPPHFSFIAGLVLAVLIIIVFLGMSFFGPSESLDPLPEHEDPDEREQSENHEKRFSLRYTALFVRVVQVV